MKKQPLYQIVAQFLTNRIKDGTYSPGQPIPSERELSKQLQINRMSVKKGISKLIASGFLISIPGKANYVKKYDNKLTVGAAHNPSGELNGMSELVRLTGETPHDRITETKIIKADPILAHTFLCPEGTELFAIGRIRSSNKQIYAFEFTLTPFHFFPKIKAANFAEDSLYFYLKKHHHQPVKREQKLKIIQANDLIAHYLKIEKSALIYFLTYTSSDAQGNIVEFTKSYMNMSQILFSTQTQHPNHFKKI